MSLLNIKRKICYLLIFSTLFAVLIFNTTGKDNYEPVTDSILDFEVPFKITDSTNNTIFGDISFNPEYLNTNQSTTLNSLISDPDGVKNATLYWQYTTLNTTLFNTSMVINSSAQVIYESDYPFERTGYLTETGFETPDPTAWMFGEFEYEGSIGEVFTAVDFKIVTAGGVGNRNLLTYYRVEAKNLTSNEWEVRTEVGVEKDGTTEIAGYPPSYTSSESVYGYRVYSIAYIGDRSTLQAPKFEHLYLYRNEYSAKVPGLSEPSFVTCYIQSYDELNNSATSENTTFLLDWTPEITVYDVPAVMKGSDDFILNVSVSDVDGLATINTSSVTAFYKIGDELNWSFLSLDYFGDFANNALFNGTIIGSILENQETSLFLMINASDEIDGQMGREGSSGIIEIILDSLNPELDDFILESDTAVINTEYITTTSSTVNITAIFDDPSGISEVNLFYAPIGDLSYTKIIMTNITDISSLIETSTFFASFPPTNETGAIAFFFETADYIGNKGNLSIIYYYADGSPPEIADLLIYPTYITNVTDVSIFFNVSDYTGVRESVLWYSIDSGQTWTNTVSNPINYTNEIDYSEEFNQTELPFLIKDAATSQMSLDVSRRGGVDTATLTVEFKHDKSTDLRIWLLVDSQDQFLIFDRELADYSVTLIIDLLDLGLTQSDFDDATFTLLFQDFLLDYSGFLTEFSIKLEHFSVPTGYLYAATIPASIIDSQVQFYITLTDTFWNDINSTTYSYYSDGIIPQIDVNEQLSPVDLDGNNFITITASVTDQNGILGAEIYFKFTDTDEWTINTMIQSEISNGYYFDIPIDMNSGVLQYYLKAYDNSGHFGESDEISFTFQNGLGPITSFVDLPFPNPLDLETKDILLIQANVTDIDGTVSDATIYYKFSAAAEWNTSVMSYNVESGFYSIDINIETRNGTLFLKIEASDNLGLTTTTDEININYINGPSDEDKTTGAIDPIVAIIAIGSIISVGTVTGLILNNRRKLKRGSLPPTSDLPSPPESQGPPE